MIMNAYNYDLLRRQQCNEVIPSTFHVHLPVDAFLFDDIVTSDHSYAMLFRSGRDIYALFIAEDGHEQTLGDVAEWSKAMGLRIERFFPPAADPGYFMREALTHFKHRFPSRSKWTTEDLSFYRRYANYSPALVRVASIDGELRRYNTISDSWQAVFDYSFRKIQVS